MNPLLIEPTDVLFFRDAVPMSAGQGKGAGCRLPFPSTLHEAFRGSLLRTSGETIRSKQIEGRPRTASRSGNWHVDGHDGRTFIATKAYRSLRTIGPLPYQNGQLRLPVPNDVARAPDGRLSRLQLWRDAAVAARQTAPRPAEFRPFCLPMAITPPDKHGQLSGWWTTAQYRAYLDTARAPGEHKNSPGEFFRPLPTADLWVAESRVGVQINPRSSASVEGQLYASSYLRMGQRTRLVAWAEVAVHDENFQHFVTTCTEVVARIKVNPASRTVDKGALFNQENIPCEALFYSVLTVLPSRRANGTLDPHAQLAELLPDQSPRILQIGGDETTGHGLCETKREELMEVAE